MYLQNSFPSRKLFFFGNKKPAVSREPDFFILKQIFGETYMSETLEIGSVKPRIRYEGDGTTTEISFAFTIFDETDVDVYADDALLTRSAAKHKAAALSSTKHRPPALKSRCTVVWNSSEPQTFRK